MLIGAREVPKTKGDRLSPQEIRFKLDSSVKRFNTNQEGGFMKRHLLVGILFLLMISILSGLALAQTQTGLIKVLGVPDRFKAANKGQSTYGLKTIGVGTRIVLAAKAINGIACRADSVIRRATRLAQNNPAARSTTCSSRLKELA